MKHVDWVGIWLNVAIGAHVLLLAVCATAIFYLITGVR